MGSRPSRRSSQPGSACWKVVVSPRTVRYHSVPISGRISVGGARSSAVIMRPDAPAADRTVECALMASRFTRSQPLTSRAMSAPRWPT